MNPSIINIVTAELAGDFRIRLTFDDATAQVVDFKPFLQRSQHPDIRAYLDAPRFRRVSPDPDGMGCPGRVFRVATFDRKQLEKGSRWRRRRKRLLAPS